MFSYRQDRDTPEFGGRSLDGVRNPDFIRIQSVGGVPVHTYGPVRHIDRNSYLLQKEAKSHGGTENPHPAEVV
ncbi:hypothetical protein GCM10009861_14240 [Neomicrococcus aestuarii]